MQKTEFPYAIARSGRPVEANTSSLYPWWSIGKAVLAAAVLRLADRGTIGLEDRYEHWPFTVRQLLQHTSGLKDYGGAAYQATVTAGDPVWTEDELLERVDARALLFEPGKGWAYSNIGYLFVRRLIERTMCADLNAALTALVFEPLDLAGTLIASEASDLAQTAWGNEAGYDPRWVYHGLLIGSPSHAAAFLHGVLAGNFLSAQMRGAMLQVHALGGAIAGRPWLTPGYGLGLMSGEMKNGGYAIGHTGAGPGSVSAVYSFRDRDVTVAVFARGADENVVENAAVNLAS